MVSGFFIALSSRASRRACSAPIVLLAALLLASCQDSSPSPTSVDASGGAPPGVGESAAPDAGLASETSAAPDAAQVEAPIPPQHAALCARPADDAIRDIFCKGQRPSVSNLRELEARLGLDGLPVDMPESEAARVQVDLTRQVETAVLLAHSTALSGQLVSPINPRAILVGKATLIAFQRGVQKVEIATADRQTGRRNFYLVTFEQACNVRPSGCLPGDLYTLQIERDWRVVRLQDEEDLKNTPLDCRMCHQRKRDTPALLMRELVGPWTHFFFPDGDHLAYDPENNPSGRTLTRAYLRAKGDESYAGLAPAVLRQTAGLTLQNAVRESLQPLQFPPSIEDQVKYSAKAGEPARSQIWDITYANFKRGRHLALPHFKFNPTDPAKLAALSDAYARYRRGELAAEALPDLADVFPDDPQLRAEIGLQTEPAASPAETLIQACGSCHNDVLDQSLSRARFNIRLAHMSRDELDLAIARIELSGDREGVMPPHGMRQLDPNGQARLLAYLRENVRSVEDDMLLDAAATLGMAEDSSGY
jgi:cytochrome c553